MITFYVTSSYWEGSSDNFLDYINLSEQDIANFINKHPNSLIMIEPSPFDCVFRNLFIQNNLDKEGYVKEGVYQTKLNGVSINFRLLSSINSIIARKEYDGRTKTYD